MDKIVYFNGLKYVRDDATGYYLNSTTRKRLHRAVWEYHHGEIPKGWQVHHVDGDKSNNDISNLLLVPKSIHATYHSQIKIAEHYDEIIQNLIDNAVPASKEWHKSDEGRNWHKLHYEKMKEKLYVKREFVCENCGKTFIAQNNKHNRFCSNACKSAYRRHSGIDDVVKTCPVCGKEFKSNKYAKKETCSRGCANRWRKLRENK